MTEQLSLDVDPPRLPPRVSRRLWCGDAQRMGMPCPYVGDKARFMPAGGCCKTIAVMAPCPNCGAQLGASGLRPGSRGHCMVCEHFWIVA